MQEINKKHTVYLGLGTNLGDRPDNINTAIKNIEERVGQVLALSSLYETEPMGFLSDNFFINAVCCVSTCLNPLELLDATQQIEKDMGRVSKSENKVYSDRIIDIDLLLFDDVVVEYPNLILPHPHLHERNFVLFPLADIASGYFHPVLKKTIEQLKKEYKKA